MEKYKSLGVFCDGKQAGTLALYQNRLCAFEYTDSWLSTGFSISPYSLPLEKKVFIPRFDPFDGLFGIFNDSLPDGWGRLLVDRMLLSRHEDPESVGQLNRLAIVGNSGMGALSFQPEYSMISPAAVDNLDRFSVECAHLLRTDYSPDLDKLFSLGGSSGGARPKILTEYNGAPWIIKFPASGDPSNIGRMEYDYTKCAEKCGISVPETHLFQSAQCDGYFGCRRFDRRQSGTGEIRKIHMATVSALLETSHRIPALDYIALHRLTLNLTKDYREVEKMFRLMCFNVFAHNRDDHSNNFSFLYQDGKWKLSPAYDLTYSSSLGGEHATCVSGNGKDPGLKELIRVAGSCAFDEAKAKHIAEDIRTAVHDMLGEYLGNTDTHEY